MGSSIFFQQLINGVSLGGVYAVMAVGFGIVFNVLKFSNFSHGGVVAISAYVGYYLSRNVTDNFWLALAATTMIGGAVGLLVERLVFRPVRRAGKPLTYFFVNSITVAMVVQQFFSAMWGAHYFAYPDFFERTAFHVSGLVISRTYLLMLVISAVVLLALTLFLRATKLGIAIRAASSDIYTPPLMGVNTDVVTGLTFVIAGLLAGITGFFLGMTYTVTPFIGSMMLRGIIAAIIGGMGSLAGGVIAGILLGAVEALLIAEVGSSVTPIIIYLGIVVLLLVRPQGIAGKPYTVKA
ncbi:MAG: branched-chain amino acid ABC transporter permease [Spirochaetaceae bacterium]|nr:MAG: branched-chain amino acid ABC transporter permease [Spirochaetaceae bacterium]